MTALMGLATRLAMAKVALHVPGELAGAEDLAPIIGAGVDLLLVGDTGDIDADVATLSTLRNRFGTTPLLLGTSGRRVAEPAGADVVHLARPGWRFWGHPRGHQWSLLGRHADHAAVARGPGKDFDYLFVGPLTALDDELLETAVQNQPPLTAGAVPWFALGNFTVEHAGTLAAAGARRIALTGEVLRRDDAIGVIRGISGKLTSAWDGDERSRAFSLQAFRF